MSPGKAEYIDLDKDGQKEVFLSFWPNVNSMPLVEYIVLKQKADMSWAPLEMIHGEEISKNALNKSYLNFAAGKLSFGEADDHSAEGG